MVVSKSVCSCLNSLSMGISKSLSMGVSQSISLGVSRSMSMGVCRGTVSYLKMTFSMSKGYSIIPVVGTLTLTMSCRSGIYEGSAMRSSSSR